MESDDSFVRLYWRIRCSVRDRSDEIVVVPRGVQVCDSDEFRINGKCVRWESDLGRTQSDDIRRYSEDKTEKEDTRDHDDEPAIFSETRG